MRTAIFLHEDYVFNFDMLEELLSKLKEDHEVVGVVSFPEKLGKHQGLAIVRAYIRMFGVATVVELGYRTLRKRLSIWTRRLTGAAAFSTFRGLCRYFDTGFAAFSDPNQPEVVAWIQENHIDVVVIFIGHILKRDVLESPRIGVLNKHSSLLPAYRGLFPVFWAMRDRERVGVTIHRVNEEIDAGEVVLQKDYDPECRDSVFDYYQLIYSEAAGLVIESLRLLERDQTKRVEHGLPASYHGLPTRADYVEFKRRGLRFV